jgi:ferredoxin
MGTLDRREFLTKAAFACPLLAAGSGTLLRARQQNNAPADDPLIVIRRSCTGCGDCADYCPVEAITMKDGLAILDAKKCTDCGKCVSGCLAEAIIRKSKYDKLGGGSKVDPDDDSPSLWDPVFDNEGTWVLTGAYKDGTSAVLEIIFVGTEKEGLIKSAETGENQGSYKVAGTKFEIKFPDGPIARGRVITGRKLAGSLPNGAGLWFAERK